MDWQKRLLTFLDTLPEDLDKADVCSWVNVCYRLRRHKRHENRNCMFETQLAKGTIRKEPAE